MVRLFQRYDNRSLPEGGRFTALTARRALGPPKMWASVGSEFGYGLDPSSSSVTSQKSSVLNILSPLDVAMILVPKSEPRLEKIWASTVTGAVPELVRISI